jgi:hypothetical protein
MPSRLVCLIWGHAVDKHVFAVRPREGFSDACVTCGHPFSRPARLKAVA